MQPLPATPENLREAARILRTGGLVIVPTETVYGLAANALDSEAVNRIFFAKGRPADNPLISHISALDQVSSLVSAWPEEAQFLAERFWPGPLTLVLPKTEAVPSATTAGLPTVAVRMPSHPVFRALIELAGVPLAAPSANPFMAVSPTSVDDLDPELMSRVDRVLDGGPCAVGIESTVIDLSGPKPLLLRPGVIGAAEIAELLGQPLSRETGPTRRSPGMNPRHYAPKAQLKVVSNAGSKPGLLYGRPAGKNQVSMPMAAREYAAMLYRAIHSLDRMGLPEILVEAPPGNEEFAAIWDRLRRACSKEK